MTFLLQGCLKDKLGLGRREGLESTYLRRKELGGPIALLGRAKGKLKGWDE